MLKNEYIQDIENEMEELKQWGLYKKEYPIVSSQSSTIKVDVNGKIKTMLNFCANNYLDLANDKRLIEMGKKTLDTYWFGTASVRFICGTTDLNKQFEKDIAKFLTFEDAISFASCYQANNWLFEALLGKEDAVISANLNHASLIQGIRLCKAQKFRYQFNDMEDLENKLKEADSSGAKKKMIVTDGVFSMDGDIADLNSICDLADKYECMVMVDDCHATWFVWENGRGTAELCGVEWRIDIISSTIGKALGWASGGFIVSKKQVVEKLRNQHKWYLFSNNLIPAIASISSEVVHILSSSKDLRTRLENNTKKFRSEMEEAWFTIRESIHPVVAVMFGDAQLSSSISREMIEEEGIYVKDFSFPVVPKNEARIRVQISAAHEEDHIDRIVESFIKVGEKYNVI